MAEIQSPNIFGSFLAGRQAQQAEEQQAIQNQFAMRQQQMQEQEFQAQQEALARQQQFNQLAGEYLGPDEVQMAGGFMPTGGAPLQAPQRPSFSQLVALDPARALQIQQAQQAQAELQRQQVQQHAKEVVMRAQYALKSAAPATLLRVGFPEFAQQLAAKGIDVDALDDDTVRGYAQTLIEHYGPIAGIGPAGGGEQFTLGEGQTRFDAQGRPIASVAGDPSKKDPTDKTFTRANVLRDEFNALATPFTVVKAAYDAIKATASQPSAAGDIALLSSFMKLNDPGSTVREGEFATAQNAGGVPDRVIAAYNSLLSGERLSDKQRADFVAQSKNLYESRASQYKQNRKKYASLATRAEVDPLDVVGEEIDEEAPTAPSGGVRKVVGGKTYVQVDGQWYEDDGT